MAHRPFKVVYNSDLIIRDRSEAATLCVFYDKVFLPFTSEATQSRLTGTRTSNDPRRDIQDWELEYSTLFKADVLERLPDAPFFPAPSPPAPSLPAPSLPAPSLPAPSLPECETVRFIEYPPELKHQSQTIRFLELPVGFEFGEIEPNDRIIESRMVRLPEPMRVYTIEHFDPGYISDVRIVTVERPKRTMLRIERIKEPKIENRIKEWKPPESVIPQKQLLSILSMPVRTIRVGESHFVAEDLAKHLIRTDIDLPQIFTTLLGQPVGRDVLAALEAEATFSYLLPKIRTYHATQILELREKVADTREGFTMHLWKLSKGLEEHAKEDTPVKEIAKYAKNLIETDLIPDYREFQRQLTAIKAGKLEKVLDVAGKIVEIDAAPWTPKFWGLLLKAVGLSIVTAASEQEQLLLNKYQAFTFMSEIEGAR